MLKLRDLALKALKGVGNATLGEWSEEGNRAYHVRRRLTPSEERHTGVVLDLRGDAEGERRFAAVRQFIPAHLRDWCRQELVTP